MDAAEIAWDCDTMSAILPIRGHPLLGCPRIGNRPEGNPTREPEMVGDPERPLLGRGGTPIISGEPGTMPDKADEAMDGEIPLGKRDARIASPSTSKSQRQERRPLDGRDGYRSELGSGARFEATAALGRWRSSGELGATPFLLDGVFRESAAGDTLDGRGDARRKRGRCGLGFDSGARKSRTHARLGPFWNVLSNAGGIRKASNLRAHSRSWGAILGRIPTVAEMRLRAIICDCGGKSNISGIGAILV